MSVAHPRHGLEGRGVVNRGAVGGRGFPSLASGQLEGSEMPKRQSAKQGESLDCHRLSGEAI